jgi:chemotaxis protein CheZ
MTDNMTPPDPSEICDTTGQASYRRDQVVTIINSVLEKVQAEEFVPKSALAKDLVELREIIEDVRKQIHSGQSEDIAGKHIPEATDELDAVVQATAEATGTIMDSCEAIQALTPQAPSEVAAPIEAEIMKIFEACSFQDITGQRISKVVRAIAMIDDKVDSLLAGLALLDDSQSETPSPETQQTEPQDDSQLLNGPQLPDKAISQEDIDKLLASFDN